MPATGQETGLTGRPEAPSPYPFPHLVRSSADFADLSSLQRLSQGEEERLLRAPREARRHSQISVLGRKHGLFVSPRLKSQATCPAKALGFCLVWVCFLALPPASILPLLTPVPGQTLQQFFFPILTKAFLFHLFDMCTDVPSMTSVQFSRSVVSDCLRPHGTQHARPPCPSATLRACSNSCPWSR